MREEKIGHQRVSAHIEAPAGTARCATSSSPVQIGVQRGTEEADSATDRRLPVVRRTPCRSESRFELSPGMVFPDYPFSKIRIGYVPEIRNQAIDLAWNSIGFPPHTEVQCHSLGEAPVILSVEAEEPLAITKGGTAKFSGSASIFARDAKQPLLNIGESPTALRPIRVFDVRLQRSAMPPHLKEWFESVNVMSFWKL